MPTNIGLGSQYEHQAAHFAVPCTTVDPETLAEKSLPNHTDLTIHPIQPPLERIAYLLDKLPTQDCFELSRRFLTTASPSLPGN
jgi:hypothetical protein